MSRIDDDVIATSDIFPFSIPKDVLHSRETKGKKVYLVFLPRFLAKVGLDNIEFRSTVLVVVGRGIYKLLRTAKTL